jgi:hypothetical protein
MHALVRFAQIPASALSAPKKSTRTLSPPSLLHSVQLGFLRYDLAKLRAKGLVEKLPRSPLCLPAEGYSVCLIFLKLFDRLYAPLTAALLHPIPADATLPAAKQSRLDRLYQCLTEAIDRLVRALGLALSSPINENKILVDTPITA